MNNMKEEGQIEELELDIKLKQRLINLFIDEETGEFFRDETGEEITPEYFFRRLEEDCKRIPVANFETDQPATPQMSVDNKAIRLFLDIANGGKEDLTRFDSWYSTDVLIYLTHVLPYHPDILRFVFHAIDSSDSEQAYYKQLVGLCHLSRLLEKAVYFIGLQSPISRNHFIFGVILNDSLLLVNPVGQSRQQQDDTKVIERVKRLGGIKTVFRSSINLQKDKNGLKSCGPICVELMRHISCLPFRTILKTFDDWGSASNEVDIRALLPETLKPLLAVNETAYQAEIEKIRRSHLEILSDPTHPQSDEEWDNMVNAGVQMIIFPLPTVNLGKSNISAEDYRINRKMLEENSAYKKLFNKRKYLELLTIRETSEAKQDNLNKVKMLVGSDHLLSECLNFKGYTGLLLAILNRKTEIAQYLIEQGAPTDKGQQLRYNDALACANENNNQVIIQLLKKHSTHSLSNRIPEPFHIPSHSVQQVDKSLLLTSNSAINQKLTQILLQLALAQDKLLDHHLAQLSEIFSELALEEQIDCLQQLLDWGLDIIWIDQPWEQQQWLKEIVQELLQKQLHESLEASSENPRKKLEEFQNYVQQLDPNLPEFKWLQSLQQKYLQLFGEWLDLDQLIKKLGIESEQIVGEEDAHTHEATLGEGNCFFHAAFGDRRNGKNQWECSKAEPMRQYWFDFLNQFKYLADPRMPNEVREILKNVLMTLFQYPHEGGQEFEQNKRIRELRATVKERQKQAKRVGGNSEEILLIFLNDEAVYQAYLNAIKQSTYYIFAEEIPLLSTLSRTVIHLWYKEANGYFNKLVYEPDKTLMQWLDQQTAEGHLKFTFDPTLWKDTKEIHIYHPGFLSRWQPAGNHYSRAKVAYLQKQLKKQPKQTEPKNLPARLSEEERIKLFAEMRRIIFEEAFDKLREITSKISSKPVYLLAYHEESAEKRALFKRLKGNLRTLWGKDQVIFPVFGLKVGQSKTQYILRMKECDTIVLLNTEALTQAFDAYQAKKLSNHELDLAFTQLTQQKSTILPFYLDDEENIISFFAHLASAPLITEEQYQEGLFTIVKQLIRQLPEKTKNAINQVKKQFNTKLKIALSATPEEQLSLFENVRQNKAQIRTEDEKERKELFDTLKTRLQKSTPPLIPPRQQLKSSSNQGLPSSEEIIQTVSEHTNLALVLNPEQKMVNRIFHFLDTKTLVKTIPLVSKKWYPLANDLEILEKKLRNCSKDMDKAIIVYKILKLKIEKYKKEILGLKDEKIKNILQDHFEVLKDNLNQIDSMLTRFHQRGFDRVTLKEHIEWLRNSITAPDIADIKKSGEDHLARVSALNMLTELDLCYVIFANALKLVDIPTQPERQPVWNEDRLWLEQQEWHTDKLAKQHLREYLAKIKQLARQNRWSIPNKCPIIYAWPVAEKAETEKWVMRFIDRLQIDLETAGIQATVDRIDIRIGQDIYTYMDQLKNCSRIIVIGTGSLLIKHQRGTHAVCNELILINRARRKEGDIVFPMLISGSYEESFPAYYELYNTIQDWQVGSYVKNLRRLLRDIFKIGTKNAKFEDAWQQFAAIPTHIQLAENGLSKPQVEKRKKESELILTKHKELGQKEADIRFEQQKSMQEEKLKHQEDVLSQALYAKKSFK